METQIYCLFIYEERAKYGVRDENCEHNAECWQASLGAM
jgi:hypothetical protein